MRETNIPNKILKWYDNNKRVLPWRKKPQPKIENISLLLVSSCFNKHR